MRMQKPPGAKPRSEWLPWPVLKIATHLPEVQLELLEILRKQLMLLLARPTPSSLRICGRRQCSRNLPTRSTQTSCQRTTNPLDSKDKNRNSTNCNLFL